MSKPEPIYKQLAWPKFGDKTSKPLIIIGDGDGKPAGLPFHRYKIATPLFVPGDWVVWTAPWQESAGRSPLVSRVARVSKVTQERGPWGPHTYHLRLHEPVACPGGRRWAYDAPVEELAEASAIDRLGRLTA